jgi:serine/threonine protein kinase
MLRLGAKLIHRDLKPANIFLAGKRHQQMLIHSKPNPTLFVLL